MGLIEAGSLPDFPLGFDAPEPFLEAVGRATYRTSASLGIGDDLRLEASDVEGCALVHGELVHATVFPRETRRAFSLFEWIATQTRRR